jgi:acyl-CoA synthetase (AMP-forming)/AMP-acid ligase II
MQGTQLGLSTILARAAGPYSASSVITRTLTERSVVTFGETAARVRQLAGGLLDIGVQPGDRVATLQWNGSGKLTLNEFINVNGSTNVPGFLSGSYSVGSNGRATGKITGSVNSVNLVFYMVSGSQGYVLENDPNTAVSGFTQLQQ